ncbi:MAG: hypothetical protein L0H93_12430, partial [Nocardioides sp.]|nr:hypothetical protein [Nocardioides sp.]
AAALAIIVPTTLFGPGLLQDDSSPDPVAPDRSWSLEEPVLLTAGAPSGGDLRVPYINDRRLVVPGGEAVEVAADYSTIAPAGDEFLGIRGQSGGEPYVDVLDGKGNVIESSPTTGTLVSSDDGSAAAWGSPSGEVFVRSGGVTTSLATLPRAVRVVALQTSGPCGSEGACRVFYNESNPQLAPGVAGSDATTGLGGSLRSVTAVSPDRVAAGLTSDPDSAPADNCSALYDVQSRAQLFDTCDYAFDEATTGFSPDGAIIVATEPDEEGNPTSLSLLDSHTGDIVAEIRVPASAARNVGSPVDTYWEDEDHLLVKTAGPASDPGFGYTVFRISLDDGSVEKLLHTVEGGGGTQPFILPN